jgi:signal transduction histidine kinase
MRRRVSSGITEGALISGAGERAGATPARSVDELWLNVLQQITARSAHEMKGALNGVSVNLEVVRSRSTKADASAASVAPFASSAVDQLELVVSMTEALLALSRPQREPVDVVETVTRLASLLAPSARVEGGSLRVEQASRELRGKAVRTRGNIVRLVIGASLLAALARKGDIRCRVEMADETVVSIECVDAEGPPEVPSEILAAASGADVRVVAEGQSISLAFPRASAARPRTPERA